MIEFRLLGPLEVERDGAAVVLGGPRPRSALAILLLDAGRVVSVERLADELYGGTAPATAVAQVHRQVSGLRKLLPEARIETTPPGYVLRLEPGQLDLHRFEQLVERGVERLELGDAARARALLREALELWRGPALADLVAEPFAQGAGARLEELRLAAVERRLEADLQLGLATEIVAELELLVGTYPFRERFVEQLMLALYRAGRQADALAAYRSQRALLADQLGLEPGPSLKRLEAEILRHDPELAPARRRPEPNAPRPLVVAVAVERRLSAALLELAAGEACETIFLQLVTAEGSLAAAAAAVEEQRGQRADVRAAAFVADDWPLDVVRFAAAHDAALVFVDAPSDRPEALVELTQMLQQSASDVGLVVRGDVGIGAGEIFVAFGGNDHDWAALEVAAAVARGSRRALRLLGTGGARDGRRDASRLLADASLAVQRAFAVASAPILAPSAPDAVLAVVDEAALVITGIGSRWRSEGLGQVRAALVTEARQPVVLVHRGPRPGILAPRESRTRFTWSLQN